MIATHRLMVIGVDGLDYDMVHRFIGVLPNFRRFLNEGFVAKAKCNFPPDSIPGWATIYTGVPPGVHGILGEFDYLSRNIARMPLDVSYLRGRCFWDLASAAGKRVCIINPFLAFPPWEVNGVMVSGPVVHTGDVLATPSSITREYHVPSMGGIEYFPSRRSLPKIAKATQELVAQQTEFARALLETESWDLFFVCYLTLDRIQHFFWRFWDAEDPTYPGPNRYENVIPEAYKLLDRCLEVLMSRLPSDMRVMIVSDHGHSRRCTSLISVNQILHQLGYLRLNRRSLGRRTLWDATERLKNHALQLAYKTGMEGLVYKTARLVPNRGEIHKSLNLVDTSGSDVFVSDIGGMTSYGGFCVSERFLSESRKPRDEALTDVISKLRTYERDQIGRQVFRWIAPRERVIEGPEIHRWPEILFELHPEFGVHWSVRGPVIMPNYVHRMVSGGHTSTSFIGIFPRPTRILLEDPSLNDYQPTILKNLGLASPESRFGRPIFA